MRRLKNGLLVIFTLLLAAAGAAMPFAAAWVQDARQADPDIRPFDSFSLTLQQKSDLGRTLRTINDGAYYMSEATKADNAVLTGGLALEAAENILTELCKHGLLEEAFLTELTGPQVLSQVMIPVDVNAAAAGIEVPPPALPSDVSDVNDAAAAGAEIPSPEGGEAPIPTWTILWDTPYDVYIWLDDASGKALTIQITGPYRKESGSNPAYLESIPELAEKWRAFLEEYYGVQVRITREERYDNAVQFILSLPLEGSEDQEDVQLELCFYYTPYFTSLSPFGS